MQERLLERGPSILGMGAGLTPDDESARRLYLSLGYISDADAVHETPWSDVKYLTKKLSSEKV